jgi:FlaA1/EpsC-like NDP-sugar epimerase
MDLNALARTVLGQRPPLFGADFARHQGRIGEELAGLCVCVIGAGGSIGRATAATLLAQRPRRTLLVDLSENNLAEVTRLLRNAHPRNAPDFEAWALDFTGPAFTALLEREQPDVVLNFAAFKHVRSEKDALTLSEMLRVNVLGNLRLLRWAQERGPLSRIFSISTDKAANPANCMGASKRLMEQLLFCADPPSPAANLTTSTRFANVLFSDGSLPASFLKRLELGQPLSGPSDVRRYFITPEEAGELCLLAACHPADREFLVPRLGPEAMLDFQSIAERVLEARGFEAQHYGDDTQAAFANLETDIAGRRWPCLFTPAATSGEKEFEEFSEPGEAESAVQPYQRITALSPQPGLAWIELSAALDSLAVRLSDPHWLKAAEKREFVALLKEFVPSFKHRELEHSLDQVV